MIITNVYEIENIHVQGILDALKDPDVEKEVKFDLADGLFWYCADCHTGMSSELYRTGCVLQTKYTYKPSIFSFGPETDEAQYIYDTLVEQD